MQPPLPRPRPEGLGEDEEAEDAEVVTRPEPAAPQLRSLNRKRKWHRSGAPPPPAPEDTRIYQVACPAVLSGVVIGEMLPPIEEGQCGERSPLSVTGVRVNGHEVGFRAR